MGSAWPPFVIFYGVRTSYKGRSALQDNIQAVLIFSTKLKLKQRAAQSERQHCRAGERRLR